ncbi:hypothetical protein FRC07_001745 [Ceratobasidium sp. 392]|nr:hypothetical protein FRC07_001745 [Ceratobasidium sp. 392]
MAATKENPIVFYDLASNNNTPWSPNTYKTRLALIYKGLPFRVEHLSYPDIEPTFKKLGVPQGSPRGTYKYTVPGTHFAWLTTLSGITSPTAIADPSPEPDGKLTYVADSWDIALYLERTYPPPLYPTLFPHHSIALHRAMALQLYKLHNHVCDVAVPLIATEHILDDKGHEYFMKTREEMYGKPMSEVLKEAEGIWLTDVRSSWSSLGDILNMNGPVEQVGPFVMGKNMSYSDFIIAGLMLWLRRAEGANGRCCKELFTWDGGRWGLIWNEIEKLEGKSTEA